MPIPIPWLECVCTCAMLKKRSISIMMVLSEALGEYFHLLKPEFHKHTSASDCTGQADCTRYYRLLL